ncbi:PTS IIA-like nitrogen regulatory protein PtsN [Rodentibacter caecimuris]|uniref:PTS IIA-like nitrogen regulatory protein PtsN n=1 Tax=Rodentibacter caecimuris TaxID=1796644 RepID=UPI0022497841|nr:PTS IIA-like nitrogen regulatory protein PtsN [Rodentibacter heylii]MCX2961410.1 PTS IIA-like nitrogen regulatory protein PtsN [Rodentibacter heylii]
MKLTELFHPENIRQGVCFSSKKRLFESIAHFIVEQLHGQKGEQACFECLFEREKLGNSGLGNGVAMPKAKLPAKATDKALAVFLQLETPIDYDAQDGKPIDLVFAVLVPENQCQTYIPVLSHLTEKITDKNFLKQLRSAKSAGEIWQVFEMADQTTEETHSLTESET